MNEKIIFKWDREKIESLLERVFERVSVEGHLWESWWKEGKPNNKGSKELAKQAAKLSGLSGRNNGSQTQEINKWVLKRQVGLERPEKREIASHGQCIM